MEAPLAGGNGRDAASLQPVVDDLTSDQSGVD